MKAMYKTKWTIFDLNDKKIKTVTLSHKDGGIYKELEPFEKKLIESNQYAIRSF